MEEGSAGDALRYAGVWRHAGLHDSGCTGRCGGNLASRLAEGLPGSTHTIKKIKKHLI